MASVTLVRRIKARPATVFDAFSTVEGLTSWWGPEDLPLLSAEADVRVGGTFRVRFPTSDGSVHECTGRFLEVKRPERITMSWQWTTGGEPTERGRTSRLELHLRPNVDGTELTLIHAELGEDAGARSHGQGWDGALNKLIEIYTTSEAGS